MLQSFSNEKDAEFHLVTICQICTRQNLAGKHISYWFFLVAITNLKWLFGVVKFWYPFLLVGIVANKICFRTAVLATYWL